MTSHQLFEAYLQLSPTEKINFDIKWYKESKTKENEVKIQRMIQFEKLMTIVDEKGEQFFDEDYLVKIFMLDPENSNSSISEDI